MLCHGLLRFIILVGALFLSMVYVRLSVRVFSLVPSIGLSPVSALDSLVLWRYLFDSSR